jgi:hypothetical protein
MTIFEDYLARVGATLEMAEPYISKDRMILIREFVEFGEPAEAVRYIAWTIVEDGIKVPAELIASIRASSSDIAGPDAVPDNLDDFAM